MMEQFIGKKFRLKESENFEEYLKFINVGLISRKTAIAVTPTSLLTKNDNGSYTFTMSTTFRSTKITFHPNEEFIEERADGVKVKSVIVFDGNDMIQTQTEDKGRKSTHIRKYSTDKLIVITQAEGWDGKCVRTYELVD